MPASEPSQPPGEPTRRPSAGKSRSLGASVGAGLALAAVVLTTFALGPTAFFVLAFVVVVVAQAELYAVFKASGYAPATLLGLISGGTLLVATYRWGPPALAFGVAVPLPLLLGWALTVPVSGVRSMIVSTYLGIVYGPFLIGFAILLLRGPDGLALTAAFIGATAVHDSAGYLFGRKLGRHPMAPKTSPGKSWEGFIAATVTVVVLGALILPFIPPFDLSLAVKLSLLMAVVAPLGDLAESMIKRDLGVADMGSLMPGHGGFFDRIDSIIFNAPAAYVALRVLGWS